MTYKTAPGNLWNQQIGYGAGCSRARIVNNSFVGTTLLTNCTRDVALNGNTFYGKVRLAREPRGRWLYKILRRVQRWTESLDIPDQGPDAAAAAFPRTSTTSDGLKAIGPSSDPTDLRWAAPTSPFTTGNGCRS